jgi:hypothetical protein
MTFKPAIWYPIAIVLSAINLVGAGLALRPPEPLHATVHIVLAAAFWMWAQRLRSGPATRELGAGLESLEIEMNELRRELSETQERLDFAERMLAQGRDAPRMGPQP